MLTVCGNCLSYAYTNLYPYMLAEKCVKYEMWLTNENVKQNNVYYKRVCKPSLCCTFCNGGEGRKGPLGLRGGDTWVRDEHMLLRSVMKKGGGLERVCM